MSLCPGTARYLGWVQHLPFVGRLTKTSKVSELSPARSEILLLRRLSHRMAASLEMRCSSLVYCGTLRGFHPQESIKWEGEHMLACNPSLLESEFVVGMLGSE